VTARPRGKSRFVKMQQPSRSNASRLDWRRRRARRLPEGRAGSWSASRASIRRRRSGSGGAARGSSRGTCCRPLRADRPVLPQRFRDPGRGRGGRFRICRRGTRGRRTSCRVRRAFERRYLDGQTVDGGRCSFHRRISSRLLRGRSGSSKKRRAPPRAAHALVRKRPHHAAGWQIILFHKRAAAVPPPTQMR
jgi:hypothetical protein